MASFSHSPILLLSLFLPLGFTFASAEITWGDGGANILDACRQLTLTLDHYSGAGFQSKNEYLFGRFDMQMKLVPGNSAGTLSSQGAGHDEVDFEFLGNSSGEPYTVHTNVYAGRKGNKEQQFRLWFDPTSSFHTYSIVWNPQWIIFMVDNIPMRVFNNHEAIGTPFPKRQPMRVYCSLWNADDWPTQGGRVKTDWSKAPFVAAYRNFNINAASNAANSVNAAAAWRTQELDARGRNRLRWVQEKYMIYNSAPILRGFRRGFRLNASAPDFELLFKKTLFQIR